MTDIEEQVSLHEEGATLSAKRIDEARGHKSDDQSVQRDNNETDQGQKKVYRKRPKYATDSESSSSTDSSSSSSDSDSDRRKRGKKRKRSKATKHGKRHRHGSSSDSSIGSDTDKRDVQPSEVRSVVSETVSNVTTSGYSRFNPHKKEKKGICFSKDMEDFLDDNFNRFIPHHKIQDLILNTLPVPDYKGFEIRKIDPLINSIMDECDGRQSDRFDKALISVQGKLMETMGPLGHLWHMFETIRSKVNSSNDEARGQVDAVDFHHILDLTEKTICLLGQTNVAINYQRRLAILEKINKQDPKKARSLLRDKQECLAKNDKHLFGEEFKVELKEFSKTKKEASEISSALGIKHHKKRKKIKHDSSKRSHAYVEDKDKYPDIVHPPFQFKPSGRTGDRYPGGKNKGKYSRGGSNSKPRGGSRYVQLCFKSFLSRKHDSRIERSRKGHSDKHKKSKSFNLISESPDIGKVTSLHKELVKNHNRQNDIKKCRRDRNKFHVISRAISKTKNSGIKSDRKRINDKRSSRNVVKRGHSPSNTLHKSISKQLVFGSEERRGSEASIKSQAPEQTHYVSALQNGGSVHDQRSPKVQRLHDKNRSKRSILSSANLSKAQKISKIRMGREVVRTHGTSIRTSRGSKIIHKNIKTGSGSVKTNGNTPYNILGRHSSHGGKSSKVRNSQKFNAVPSSKPGVFDKLEKIKTTSDPKVGFSGVSNRQCKNDVLPSGGQSSPNKREMCRNIKCKESDSQTGSTINGKTVVLNASNFSGRLTKSISPNGANQRSSNEKIVRTRNRTLTKSKGRINLVDNQNRRIQRKSNYIPLSRLCYDLRRLKSRVGGFFSKRKYRWHVGGSRNRLAYKRKRIISGIFSLANVRKRQKACSNSSQSRQHISQVLHQSVRGYQIIRPKCNNEKNLGLVPDKGDNPHRRTLARGPELCSGLALEECPRFQRLESQSECLRSNSDNNGSLRDRPVCIQTKLQNKEVCELETGSVELCDGRFSDVLDITNGLCIPSLCTDRSLFGQGQKRQCDNSTDSSCLAGSAMVPDDTGNVDSGSNKNPKFSRSTIVTQGGTASLNINRSDESSRLENFGGDGFTANLSKAASTLHEKAWRPGTLRSYKNSWGKWVSWCSEQSINPVQATLADTIEFLTKLFKDGLQYRTIITYRSALSKYHPLIEGTQVGKHPFVVRHMRAIFNERTPTSKYGFTWDVDIVLNEILSWGNNDDMDLKLLSWKLVMLLALTSAGRSSELGMLNCNYMKQQGTKMFFDLTKHTKTCRPGSKPKSLSFDSFPEDKNLCVVTCINNYILRTKSWRNINDKTDRSWLLLSYVKPHNPIVSSSIARWLKETIKKAGISGIFTGHSTRSASTSKAKRVGLSSQDVINQANWTNQSTFMRFYCKPVIQNNYQQAVLTRSQK